MKYRTDTFIDQQLAILKGLKRKPKKPPMPFSVRNVEKLYNSKLNEMLDFLFKKTEEILIESIQSLINQYKRERPSFDAFDLKNDQIGDEIDKKINRISLEFYEDYTDEEIETIAKRIGFETNQINHQSFQNQFKKILGVSISIAEPFLSSEINLFTKRNVSLIKTLPNQFLDRIESKIYNDITQGKLLREIEKDLRNEFRITKNRAKLIARDQVAKFNGSLTKNRQLNIGVKEYVWSTSLDERVRGNPFGKYKKAKYSHYAREGKTFRWSEPPEDGHPTEPVNCRCVALPVVE